MPPTALPTRTGSIPPPQRRHESVIPASGQRLEPRKETTHEEQTGLGVCVEDAASLAAAGNQQMEPRTLRNRKPETTGSGEAPRGVEVRTAAQDTADTPSRTAAPSWAEKPKRAGMHFTWNPTVRNTPSYRGQRIHVYPCTPASNWDSKLKFD